MSDHFTEWSFYWVEKTWNSCWKNRPLFENPLCFETVIWAQNQDRPFSCLLRCSCNDFPYFLCKLLVKCVCWQNKTRFRSFTSTFSYLVVSEKRSFYWVIILLSWKFIRKKRKTIILLSDHFTETWLYYDLRKLSCRLNDRIMLSITAAWRRRPSRHRRSRPGSTC